MYTTYSIVRKLCEWIAREACLTVNGPCLLPNLGEATKAD